MFGIAKHRGVRRAECVAFFLIFIDHPRQDGSC